MTTTETHPLFQCERDGCSEPIFRMDAYETGEYIFDNTTGVHEPVMSGRSWRSRFCEPHHSEHLAGHDGPVDADELPFE